MKNYLSFGGGVNSVAMYLLLKDQGIEFEALFVDHSTDHPDTYKYINMFKKKYPLTILKSKYQGYNLYDYFYLKKALPSIRRRDCTYKFKIIPIYKHIGKTNCFMMIGIDSGEAHRARIATKKSVENRYPLIENDIDRDGCKEIIKAHGLPLPPKSGCYLCPLQRIQSWVNLRRNNPDLFCKAKKLEDNCNEERKRHGAKPFLFVKGKALLNVVEEKQNFLFIEDEYPPCHCGL